MGLEIISSGSGAGFGRIAWRHVSYEHGLASYEHDDGVTEDGFLKADTKGLGANGAGHRALGNPYQLALGNPYQLALGNP